jgi:hypothetical protein
VFKRALIPYKDTFGFLKDTVDKPRLRGILKGRRASIWEALSRSEGKK